MKDTKPNVTVETEVPPEHVAAADQVLKALTKLVAGRKIYAANNPRLEQFRHEVGTAMRRFFEFEDDLVLQVDQFTIRWNDHVVYENPRREESLAFLLFKDGVGELTFRPKSVGEEVERLVEMLADELHSLGGDEDIVTRLWNANFTFISYRVLDDYLDQQFGSGNTDASSEVRSDETSDHPELLPNQTGFADKGRVVVDKASALISIDAYLRSLATRHHHNDNDHEREAMYQRMLRASFNFTGEESTLYRDELARERGEDGVAAFTDAMLSFTLLTDLTAVRDVIAVVDRLIEYALHEKSAATLERILVTVREFRGRDDLTETARQFCDKALARLCDPALVASFLEAAEGEARGDFGVAYAKAVGTPALDALVKSLHRVDGSLVHKRICDAILAIAGESPQAVMDIIDKLDVDRPEEAIDAVYLAKSLSVRALTPRLRELVFYPDARVKLEMLGIVSADNDEDATQLLLQSLQDLDKRVRIRVLEALASRRDMKVRERLTDLAFGKDLAEKAMEEQEAIFKALGSVGDARTLEQLRAMLEKRKLLSKGNEAKMLAIRALERMRERGALDLLARLCEDSSDPVRTRAQRAKEHLQATLSGASPRGGDAA